MTQGGPATESRDGRVVRMVLLAGLLAGLTGCVSVPVAGTADARIVGALKELPREGAWELLQCWGGVRVVVSERVNTMGISACLLYVNPQVLSWPHEIIRAALAHELGHMFNNDAGVYRRAETTAIERERQADAVAVRLLSRLNLEACLALPRFLAAMNDSGGKTHPASGIRARETAALCHAQAKENR